GRADVGDSRGHRRARRRRRARGLGSRCRQFPAIALALHILELALPPAILVPVAAPRAVAAERATAAGRARRCACGGMRRDGRRRLRGSGGVLRRRPGFGLALHLRKLALPPPALVPVAAGGRLHSRWGPGIAGRAAARLPFGQLALPDTI